MDSDYGEEDTTEDTEGTESCCFLCVLCALCGFPKPNSQKIIKSLLWGAISDELEIPEIVGDVATGVGLSVREFCPDAKNENFMRWLIVLCLTTTLGGG
uniref:Uncharacterized protein n=1 Tax=Candidatus Methanogaster sp. ANME-2c ERB4 TaxID=2759911 RepID=A0A7G9YG98_9EURY|nr:hypothetical protein LBHKAHFG_00013 [Methanosarcinales archaeon ANME-2c ERB4]